MKKRIIGISLAALLCSNAAISYADAKSSADFTDLKDLDAATKAKFDAMISAGIFDGVSDTTFGLKDEMNRAQFAKVAALIMGLDVNSDLKTSSFSDVSSSDPGNGYALPYIEALKAAGVTEGYGEGTYNPAGKVTKEQLAAFLDRILGKDAEAKTLTGTDSTVTDWAQGYVAEALALKLLSNNEDGTFGGKANATRDLLLTGAYEAKQQYVVPAGKVSVTEGKAIGVKKINVTLNKPVDTAKAKLSVSKGSASVAWADDKKSAVLTFDNNLEEGKYTVTLSGLDAADVDNTAVIVDVQAEKVVKLEFASASDTIAYAKQVGIPFKATNQYGEAVQNPKLDVYPSAAASIDLKRMTVIADTTGPDMQQGISILPITLVDTDTRVTVTKNFKVGTAPIPAKLEINGSLRDSNGNEVSQAEWSHDYHVNFDVYDQYGSLLLSPASNLSGVSSIISPYIGSASFRTVEAARSGESGIYSLPFTMPSEGKGGDYTINLNVGGSSSSLTFHAAEPPAAEAPAVIAQVATPRADVEAGTVDSHTSVSLSDATRGAAIYYTTDGTKPSRSNGILYDSDHPIVITSTTTIKAVAVKSGMTNSGVFTATYTVETETPPVSVPALLDISGLSFGNSGPGFGNIAGAISLPTGATQLMIATSSSPFLTPGAGTVMSDYTPCSLLAGGQLSGYCTYAYSSETYYMALVATDANGQLVAFATVPMSGSLEQSQQPAIEDVSIEPVYAGSVATLTLNFLSPELNASTLSINRAADLISSLTVNGSTALPISAIQWMPSVMSFLPSTLLITLDSGVSLNVDDHITVTFKDGALLDANGDALATTAFEKDVVSRVD